jgi:excisionase family DNA binding protein
MKHTASDTELLTVGQAAALLQVHVQTMRRWVVAKKVPYVLLPSGSRRIPRAALLASLGGNYDFAGELAKQDEGGADVTEGHLGVTRAHGK